MSPPRDGAPKPKNLRHAFVWLIATQICVHACMAVTLLNASQWGSKRG